MSIQHENGRIEVHGLEGSLGITAQHSTFETSDVQGDVEASLTRSLGRFHRLRGDLAVDSLMARIEASAVAGGLFIQGVLSPIALARPLASVTLSSERGNVVVELDDDTEWSLQLTAEKGTIQATLPQDFAISHQDRNDGQMLTAVKGRGCPELVEYFFGQRLLWISQLVVQLVAVVLGNIFDFVAVDHVGGLGRSQREQPSFHVKLGIAKVDLKAIARCGGYDQFAPLL